MEKKLTKLEHSHLEVLVTIDEKTWKAAQKKAFDKQAANVTIDGFRKGKAPANLVRSRIDNMKVIDEAINALLPGIYRSIIEEDGVRPYAQPTVDITKVSDSELEIKFVIVTAPEVKLGQYKGLKIGHGSVEVSEEDVDKAIEQLLANNAYLMVKEGESVLGDTVVIDFVGSVDGVPFEGGEAQNYELELGSHSFIPGFEEQLVGHKAGDHVEVNVTFPENYGAENLKGKPALFACDIHEVKEKKLPELNDDFVKEQNIQGVETVAQLRINKRSEVEKQKADQERNEYMNKLLDEIVKGSEIDIPQEIIDAQVKGQRQNIENQVSQSGLTLEQYLQFIGQSEEEFTAQLKANAEKDIARFTVIDEIAKVEKIEITDEELEFEFAKLAEQYNMKIDDVKKALERQLSQFKGDLLNKRVEQFLLENNE